MDFSPSIYEHAAALIGQTPYATSRDPGLLFNAHAEAYRTYRHTPVVLGIDIYNLEAEAYGATIGEPEGNGIPAIAEHIGSEPSDILALSLFDPKSAGRIPMVIEAGKRFVQAFPNADVRIPVCGPFSLACNLIGFDGLLCGIVDDPDGVKEALSHLVEGQSRFCHEVAKHGIGIAFFESGATPPLLAPAQFSDIELPPLRTMLANAASAAGRSVPCIIGGDTVGILDSILETGTGYVICPAETDQARFMSIMRGHPGVRVRINANSNVFATGTIDDVRQELERCLKLADGHPNACIGSGALPFEAKPEIVLAAGDFVRSWTT